MGSLVYRPEKGLLRAAVQWLARTPASRSSGAVPALAAVFDVDTPALRERAVRLAVKLAPYVDAPGRESIREAATRLPSVLRERVAAAYGPVDEMEPERPVAAVLRVPALPGLAPPFTSPAELVTELRALGWIDEPLRCERVLAGLVELTHGDRDAMTAALWQWWEETRSLPGDPGRQVFDRNAYEAALALAERCTGIRLTPEQVRGPLPYAASVAHLYEVRDGQPPALAY
jgi:hypothetical protein